MRPLIAHILAEELSQRCMLLQIHSLAKAIHDYIRQLIDVAMLAACSAPCWVLLFASTFSCMSMMLGFIELLAVPFFFVLLVYGGGHVVHDSLISLPYVQMNSY